MTTTTNIPTLASAPSFPPDSRVWVYTADRRLTDAEVSFAQEQLEVFCRQWTAHNLALQASAEVFQNQFIILLVDETQAGASGCSIDKSVHFLEQLGRHLGADFFERMRFGWVDEAGKLQFAARADFAALAQEGRIADSTLVVNPMVQTKQELKEKWLVPFSGSWHKRLV